MYGDGKGVIWRWWWGGGGESFLNGRSGRSPNGRHHWAHQLFILCLSILNFVQLPFQGLWGIFIGLKLISQRCNGWEGGGGEGAIFYIMWRQPPVYSSQEITKNLLNLWACCGWVVMLVVVGLRTTFLASASFVTHQQEHGGVRLKPGIWISGDGDIDEVDEKVDEEIDDVDDNFMLIRSPKKNGIVNLWPISC